MMDEPYRWLEAVENRREYARSQLKGAALVAAVQLESGILVASRGLGQSKVFEVFDRHALAAFGHPADIEKTRQSVIDAAHLEAFARAPEDVSLRRLVSFGLGPLLKNAFEQIYSAPFLVGLLLVEVNASPARDQFAKVRHDGTFEFTHGPVAVAAPDPGGEAALEAEIQAKLAGCADGQEALGLLAPFLGTGAMAAGVRIEAGFLKRTPRGRARYQPLQWEGAHPA